MAVGLWGESVAGMNTQLAGQHWFVLLNGKRHGPFTFAALTKAAKQGAITAETNVWRRGWQKWHPARQVPGLLTEAPLAPDDAEWTDERLGSPNEEALLYAPPRRGTRPSPDVITLRGDSLSPGDPKEHIFADEWRMLAERPAPDRGKTGTSPRFGRKRTPKTVDLDEAGHDVAAHRLAARTETADDTPSVGGGSRLYKRAAMGLFAIFLVGGAGWLVLGPGSLRQSTDTKQLKAAPAAPSAAVMPAANDLPAAVASLPAVVALQRNDPAAFERFKKRYADSAPNAQDDEVLSLARAALRKSVKHLLAIASGDILLEITETSLAYMQGLQASNPESCVALSDESKGAKLTSNLAKELPVQFVRDMSVLERIASTNPHTTVAPMSTDEARPHLETVFNALRQQSVKTELLGRAKLEPADFAPYCALVIAFYQAVLDLPRDDKVNLLRYLYAAAANADGDLAK
jgi:GYF domain 2